MSSYTQQPQWPSWGYSEVNDNFNGYSHYPNYSSYLAESMDAYQTHHHHHLVHNHQMSRTTESKPRLSKEEVEILEAEFQKNHKPNSTIKKALAESMRVDNARINNWFQNRRAREKKERNIREYEARQKLEKERSQPVSGVSVAQRNNDLVASSAPFPNAHGSSRSQTGTPEGPLSPTFRANSKGNGVHTILPSTEMSPQLSSPQVIIKQESKSEHSGTSPSSYSDHNEQSYMVSPSGSASGYYMSQLPQPLSSGVAQDADGYQAGADATLDQKVSQTIDIAARRNRRPPPLAIAGSSRSQSTGLLKTGVEMGKRLDIGNSMRRVASATGPMRVTKPSGAPRSPFYNRSNGDGFQLRRSPVQSATKGAHAPPTPDTPVVVSSQAAEAIAQADSDSESSDRFSSSDIAVHDPTLRTPPTTPGVMDSYFSLNAVYDMQVSENNLLTPGIGSYGGNLDVPAVSMTVPAYLSNSSGCGSQPVTPSFPTPQANSGYFALAVNNSEYNWPANNNPASSRTSSPPARSAQQTQFMNITTSNFSPER